LRVVGGVFQKRHADSHHHRAFDLVAARERINDAACVDHSDDAIDTQPRDLGLPGHFSEVTAKRMHGELRLLFAAENPFRSAIAGNETKVGAFQYIGERNTSARSIRFHEEVSALEAQVVRLAVWKW